MCFQQEVLQYYISLRWWWVFLLYVFWEVHINSEWLLPEKKNKIKHEFICPFLVSAGTLFFLYGLDGSLFIVSSAVLSLSNTAIFSWYSEACGPLCIFVSWKNTILVQVEAYNFFFEFVNPHNHLKLIDHGRNLHQSKHTCWIDLNKLYQMVSFI